MNIHGKLLHSGTSETLPVALITSGDKQIGVAVIVGSYQDDTTCDTGNACIALLGNAANEKGLLGTRHKVELATKAGAAARIQMVIAAAQDGDCIVFMCADSAIFDIAWPTLNVRR